MELGISERRALVVASSSGLGLGAARALADAGARVAISGRDSARLDHALESVPGAVAVSGDVSTVDGARSLANDAAAALGGVDILIPNAGGPPAGGYDDVALEDYSRALELNLLSVVALCDELVPPMRAQGWGRVVAITSISVRQPIENLILSNTARTGVTGFLKTLARTIAADGVTVNSVQPGLHATARLADLHGDDLAELARTVPTGTLGDADDFGRVCAFLCSESAKFITGAAVPVTGGADAGLQ